MTAEIVGPRITPGPKPVPLPPALKRPLAWSVGLVFDIFFRDYKVDGLTFRVPKDLTDRPFRSRFLRGRYEQSEQALVRQYIRPGMAVLELGACIGVVSAVTSKALGFSDRHVVVEANPRLIPCLTDNLRANGCPTRIEHALVSRTSSGLFFLHDLIVGGSNYRPTGERVRVPVMTVDDIEANNGIRFDVLIMDIEGGEEEFIEQNAVWLKGINLALIEMHNSILDSDKLIQLREILFDAGLRMIERVDITEVWVRPPIGDS